MSDIIDKNTGMKMNEMGMLFLFDVVNSTQYTAKEGNVQNSIFYGQIINVVEKIVDNFNYTYKDELFIGQNTGDGCYIFCKNPEVCIRLWISLCDNFSKNGIQIRCGAGYGYVALNSKNIGSDLGNRVSRCCSFSKRPGVLTVTCELFEHLKCTELYRAINPIEEFIEQPDLKGYPDLKVYKLSRTENVKTRGVENLDSDLWDKEIKEQKTFIGRNLVVKECLYSMLDAFGRNDIFNIWGISGAGKTTLANCSVELFNGKAICIDLRQITNLQELHKLLIDVLFEELKKNKLVKLVNFVDVNTIKKILINISDIVLIFDHSELINDNDNKQWINFLEMVNELRTHIILTSTCKFSFDKIRVSEYYLENPNNSEKSEMLAYWINTKKAWIDSIGEQITNHSYLICLVGQKCRGRYSRKKDLEYAINEQLEEVDSVSSYLSKIVNELTIKDRFWIYLAYLCNGSIYSNVLPNKVLNAYKELGIIKEISTYIVFHPLVMKAVDTQQNIIELEEIVCEQLDDIKEERYQTLIEYYKYVCNKKRNPHYAKRILINNWQAWSEEIDSYNTQAMIETMKNMGVIEEKERCLFDLFKNIISIFQGRKEDLLLSSNKCFEIYLNEDAPDVVRLLAIIEHIECQRKLFGPEYAIKKINEYTEEINIILKICLSEDYTYYGKNYYIGTFYFLIGNILRSNEDFENAINVYNTSQNYINICEDSLRNAELQKMHIAYGIAESHLRNCQFHLAIELANESLRNIKTTSKFGIALMYLLKARAYLGTFFSKENNNFRDGLKSVKKAEELFDSIRLPYYLERCKLVEGALYAKMRRKSKARIILIELQDLLTGADDLLERTNILLNYVIGIHGKITEDSIDIIVKRKGIEIGKFYSMLSGIECNLSKKYNKTIGTVHIQKGCIICAEIVRDLPERRNMTWLVD